MKSSSTSPRLAFLDTLRGIAILMVFADHSIGTIQPAFRTFQLEHFQLGRAGVFLFFLCSGFVIPISIERHSSLHQFWIGRFFRLYPLYWVCIAAVLTLGIGDTNDRAAILANFTMAAMWLRQPLLWPIYWSLCIELLFYIGMSVCFTLGALKHTVALTLGVIFLGGLIEAILALCGQPMTYEVFCNLATLLLGTIAYRVYQGTLDRRQAMLVMALAVGMFVIIGFLTTPGMAPARLVALAIFLQSEEHGVAVFGPAHMVDLNSDIVHRVDLAVASAIH